MELINLVENLSNKIFQYKCDLCGKDFRQKAILDSHSRTHGSQRPYCCPLSNCRRRFAGENVRRIILFKESSLQRLYFFTGTEKTH